MEKKLKELEESRSQLKELFTDLGIDGWHDTVYLADLIEKPLYRQIEALQTLLAQREKALEQAVEMTRMTVRDGVTYKGIEIRERFQWVLQGDDTLIGRKELAAYLKEKEGKK